MPISLSLLALAHICTGDPSIPVMLEVSVMLDETIYDIAYSTHDDFRKVARDFVDTLGGFSHEGAGCPPGDKHCLAQQVEDVMSSMAAEEQLRPLHLWLRLPLPSQLVILRTVYISYSITHEEPVPSLSYLDAPRGVVTPLGHTACVGVHQQPPEMWACFEQEPHQRTLSLVLDDGVVPRGPLPMHLHVYFHNHTHRRALSDGPSLSTSVLLDFQPFTELTEAPPPLDPPPQEAIRASVAVATLLYSDSYLPGALALLQSLIDTNTTASRVVLVGPGVSEGALAQLAALSHRVIPSGELQDMPEAPVGTMLPGLGAGVWLKLQLWQLMDFDRILYLDADAIATRNVDLVLTSPSLDGKDIAVVGGYFAGAVLLLRPSLSTFASMSAHLMGPLAAAKLDYGEQDFLNHYYDRAHGPGRHGRAQLPGEYHCLADDLDERDVGRGDVTRAESGKRECHVVEFMSCGTLRWKPWHDESALRKPGTKLCRNEPGDAFWSLHARWKDVYARAVAAVGASARRAVVPHNNTVDALHGLNVGVPQPMLVDAFDGLS